LASLLFYLSSLLSILRKGYFSLANSFFWQILKPAFTVIRDKESKCLFVFIQGNREIKDTLTYAIGAPVSFNHFICSDGELKKSEERVSGHGHRDMVAAAGWIKKHCTPKLLHELRQYPNFQIKVLYILASYSCFFGRILIL